jgi:hypothetical protein
MLPNGYRFASGPAYLKLLTARDPKNTNAPGLQGNKNGPPGPEGNQKGPPGKTASSVDLPPPPPPATPTTPSLSTSPFPGSTSSTPSSLVTTSISTSSLDLTSSSAIVTSTSFLTSYTTNRSTVQSLTAADISTSGDGISTATSYLAPVPSSSGLVLFTVSTGKTPLQTTSASADSTSAVTTSQSWMYSSAPNGTGSFKSNLLSPGQKAGISIGTIGMLYLHSSVSP